MTLDTKIPDGPLDKKWTTYKNNAKIINPANKRKFKILIVGTGLAGSSAAATLGEQGFQVEWESIGFNAALQAIAAEAQGFPYLLQVLAHATWEVAKPSGTGEVLDVGEVQAGLPLADDADAPSRIMRIPAPLLCYWMGAAELPGDTQ